MHILIKWKSHVLLMVSIGSSQLKNLGPSLLFLLNKVSQRSGSGGAFQLPNSLFLLKECQQASFQAPRGCVRETPFLLTFLSWVWKC